MSEVGGGAAGRTAQLRWNATTAPYPSESSVPAQVAARVAECPEAVALVDGDRRTSYAALHRMSSRLAHRLRGAGVVDDEVVTICMARSDALVIAELATLIAGGAYLVVAPDDAPRRALHLRTKARSRVVLTTPELGDRFADGGATVVALDPCDFVDDGATVEEVRSSVGSRGLAYVAVTSGTSGEPKAVMIEHRSLLRLVLGTDYVDLGPRRVLLHASPPSFDASTFEVWGALLNGATCVVHRERASDLAALARTIAGNGVDTAWLTSSLFNLIVDQAPATLAPVRQLIVGGEALSPHHVRRALTLLPKVRLVNGYGPTETTTFACCHQLLPPVEPARPVPIGRPLANTTAFVLRDDGTPADVGELGELFIGGHGVARGYIGDEALTARSFRPDPFSPEPGARLYASGDLARWLPEGVLELAGRRDSQVKIRGHRVEIDAVELALRQIPQVREAAVVARSDDAYGRRLVAYVVFRDGSRLPADALRAALGERLPAPHVPSTFVELSQLPLAANGKLDRNALPQPGGRRPALDTPFEPPRTATERLVTETFGAVLGLDDIGVTDNFFELGGDSLLVAEAAARLARHGTDIGAPAIFRHQSARRVAAATDGARAPRSDTPPPVMGSATIGPLSRAQQSIAAAIERHPDATLAYTICTELSLTERLPVEELAAALDLAQQRQESLRTVFHRGPPWRAHLGSDRVPVELVDLTGLPAAEVRSALDRSRAVDLATPIEVDGERPLFRASLVHLPGQRSVLRIAAHHIVFDGWSVGLLLREIAAAHAEVTQRRPRPVEPPRFQYRDFAHWQAGWPTPGVRTAELDYWVRQLAGAQPVELAGTYRRGDRSSGGSGLIDAVAFPGAAPRLRELSARHGVTLFTTMAAAFVTVLHGCTGQDDLVVSTPVNGRARPEFDDVIGCFYNSVLLRIDVRGARSFLGLLDRVRTVTLGALDHQHTHFDDVMAAVSGPFDRVKFALQDRRSLQLHRPAAPWMDLDSTRVHSPGTTRRDLHLHAWDTGAELRLQLRYSADLFDVEGARRLLHRYAAVLRTVAETPAVPIDVLSSGLTGR